jgi:hypothetical protein
MMWEHVLVKMNKKALSQVVTTVIIIFFVLVLIGVVFATVQNLIERKQVQLSASIDCIDTISNPEIEIEKACYNLKTKETEITLSRKYLDKEITSLTFIINPDSDTSIWSCSKECGNCQILEGKKKTYYFNTKDKPEEVKIIIQDCKPSKGKIVTDC